MNNQQVFELWKEITLKDRQADGAVYQKADDFVSGKTNNLEIIQRNGKRYIGFWQYPKDLTEQLDGDGAQTAKRALLAFSQMFFGGALPAYNFADVPVAARIGYSLTDCIYSEKIYAHSLPAYVSVLMKSYPEQAAEIITADNIGKIAAGKPVYAAGSLMKPDKIDVNSQILFMLIAKEVIKNGAADSEKLKDALCRALTDMSMPVGFFDVICGIHEGHKGLTELMKKYLENSYSMNRYISYYGKQPRKEIFDKLGMYEEYLYAVLCGRADRGNYGDVLAEAAADEGLFMRMTDRAEKNKFTTDLCCMALLAAKAKALGGGEKILGRLEKHFGEMLGEYRKFDIIVGEFKMKTSYKPEKFIPAAYKDPAAAADMIYFTESLSRGTGYDIVIYAFSVLYGCSEKARAIYTALLLAAHKAGEGGKILKCFAKSRSEILGISFCDSYERLYEDGISADIIFEGMAQCNEDWRLKNPNTESPGFVKAHSKEAMEYFGKISKDAKRAAWLAELIVKKCGVFEPEFAVTLFTHKSKVIQKMIGDVMASREDEVRGEFEKILPKLKGDAKARSEALLKRWDNARKYGKDFDFKTPELAESFAEENFTSAHEKAVSFIPEELLTDVRYGDLSGTASVRLMKYIIGEYMISDAPANLPICGKLAAVLHAPDLQSCLENILQSWIDGGADTKKKMILVPYCVLGSDGQVMGMKKQLLKWAEASRGALAAFAVTAMAVNGKSPALMTVSDIGAKFPNNMVKKSAKSAFSYAAKSFGVTADVLADRIVPALGFDERGEQAVDYGARQFTVSLMPDFSLKIYDNEKGKEIKSLPKPGAGDDEAKAEAARKGFSELKKQIKAVTGSQKARMEIVFRNGRTWTRDAWDELFGKNPLMNIIARQLIWGVYDEERALVKSFRYADDGTLCDENDDIYELAEGAAISLVHPIELDKESIEAWSEQLSDYEICQPFPQISARVITLEDEDIGEDNRLEKYSQKSFTVAAVSSAAKKYGMDRCSVEDAGGFAGYHLRDRELGIGFAVHSDELWVGKEYDETVKATEVFFYELPEEETDKPSSYEQYTAVNPKSISKRFVSYCLNIAESIFTE